MFDKAAKFLEKITDKDNVVVIFNNDGDGVCSCTLLEKYLDTKGCKPLIISQPMPPEDKLIRKIQTTVPTKIIFLDMAIDQENDFMRRLGHLCDMLIVDHHQVTKNMNKPGIVHINPRISKKDTYQSATYLVYKIISKLGDFSESLWIVSVGMISDYNLDDSLDLVQEVRKKYGIKNEKMYDHDFGRLADMVSAAKATKLLTMEQIVEIFKNIKDPYAIESVRNSDKLIEAYREVENEFLRIRAEFETKTEKTGNVVFYRIGSKYNLRSPVSTMLSEKHPDKLVVIYEKVTSWINISARNQSKRYNTGNLLKKAAEGLHGSAGGHEAAAGAKVPEKNWEEFKERIIGLANSE